MKDIYDLVQENEENLNDFLDWQIEFKPTDDFRSFAENTAKAQDVFKYAAILYPKLILVENVVVLSDHYTKENWNDWRKKLSPKEAANIINHTHIEDYLPNDYQGTQKIEDGLGNLLAFFWQLSANHQFPDKNIEVEYDGDVINIFNQ
ncbi:MAG: hypothetical protein OQL19_20670 [Gammaproteobacteria bacterium]|nr:hypothetical protein [Gammaproteobacteria bacterium]